MKEDKQKGTLTLKAIHKLAKEADKMGIAGDLVIERFDGVILNFKFPFVHGVRTIRLREK